MVIDSTHRATDLRPRVLLVDDRPDNLLALRAVLEPLGLETVEANSGEEALRHLLADEFSLIVLDVQMPVLDGFETARLIKGRERTRHVPIIFLTAISGGPEHYLRGYETGAVDYVYKPFEPDILRAKVAVFTELWIRGTTIEHQRAELAERVAELARAHTALSQQSVELERSNAALERFAQVTAAEIKEPLYTVAGLLDLLSHRHGDVLPEEAGLLAGRASAGIERARDRVAELLEYARSATAALHREPVPLREVLDNAQAELGVSLKEAGVTVTAGTLPTVEGDRAQLTRLFVNLLEHSVHPPRSAVCDVSVWGARAGRGWRVGLSDPCWKVVPADLPRLFTVFARRAADGDTRVLRLAVCRRIVDRHGGTIWAEPGAEGGATVFFELADPPGPGGTAGPSSGP